jgi:hypothetical protein
MRSLREPPTPLGNLRPGVDPGLTELLERCLAKEPERRPTARFLAKAFQGEAEGTASGATTAQAQGDVDVIQSLFKRRLPQIVVVTAVILYALLQFVDMLADRGVAPGWAFQVALNTFVCGVAASAVIAWFHGKEGKQAVKPLEIALLGVIGVVWLVLDLVVILRA